MYRRELCGAGAAVAAFVVCGGALGQNIGPSLGTVELRWRERSTAGYNGSYTIGPWVTPGADSVPTPDPSAASVTTQDASVVLVLEAKVTQASEIIGNPIRGFRGANFDVITNQTAGGAFARQTITDAVSQLNPRANARINTTNLGFDPSTLPGFPAGAPRGLVSPFRQAATDGGLTNGPALGIIRNGNVNAIHRVFPALELAYLDPANLDATNPGEYELAGMNAWVPIFVAIYNITDITTPRDIVFTVANIENSPGPAITDYQFRTWRGQSNPENGNIDLWRLNPAFTAPPTFTVHVVPGPGASGVLGLAGMLAVARRRR